jgi:hypothetical protein
MSGTLGTENWYLVRGDLPPDFKWTVLKAVHDFGYVYKKGLAQLMRVHEVTMKRFIDELVEEQYVRLAGHSVGCPHPGFLYKFFYTTTRADLWDRPEIIPFHARTDYVNMRGRGMPLCCFRVRRGLRPERVAGSAGTAREEWVPIHLAGAHVAMAFVASVINTASANVESLGFTPERVLRRAAIPLVPMPDGIISVNGTAYQYQVEFESYKKGSKKVYEELFDRYERAALPTIYIALTPQIAGVLDKVAQDRKRIAVVMYGDRDGCVNAIGGLNNDLFWQPRKRSMAGYDLEA